MPKAKPWIVDAAQLQDEADDIAAFRRRILHETDVIADFLSLDGRDRLYVIAPKGYGKTLLLQAKRLLLQQHRQGVVLSPANLLVDRPENVPVSWTREQLEGYVKDYRYWSEIWAMAIRIAAVGTYYRPRGCGEEPARGASAADAARPEVDLSGLKSARLQQILRAPGAPLLSGVFVALLRADRREYFRIVADVADHINPLCRGIHSGMAFFIDNVDEMFHRSIQDAVGAPGGAGRLGDRLGDVWALAQLGLARASFDMSRINPHIRVYSSLRREAWLRLGDFDPNAAQVNGRALEVSYTADDLKAIFLKNVANEPADNLVEPHAADPLARFVGTENLTAVHDYARRPEHILDFVLRHTLLRPRDLMLIGERLSDVGPARRRGAGVEEAIYQAAAQVADWYQGEMSLFVYKPDRRLYQLVDRNVLTRDDLARIAQAYRDLVAAGEAEHAREEAGHPFCSLYKLGLLGVIRDARDAAPDGEGPVQRQRFAGPDEIVAEGRVGILPQSPFYLVHPSLNLTIEAAHGTDYLRNFETRNTIGHGYAWVEDAIASYVLKGDIVGSRRTAENPEYAQRYPALFRHWVEQECAKLGVRHHAVEGGDSLLLVDGSAAKLLAAAKAVLARMHRFAEHPCTMRFGAASGVVHGLGGGPITGSALGTAARLEPTAQHGTVVATDGFWEDARAAWGDRAARRLDASFRAFRYHEGKFQIRKNRADPPTEAGLWRIRLLPD